VVWGLGFRVGGWGYGAASSVPNDIVRCGDPGETTKVYCVI